MSPSDSSSSARGSCSTRKLLGPVLILVGAFGCVSAPESTTDSEDAHGIDELSSMVTGGDAKPVESTSDVFTIGAEQASEDTLVPIENSPLELTRIEDALAIRDARENGELAKPAEPVAVSKPAPNPYLTFGERIVVHPDGRITKPYALPPGKGKRVLDLMLLMSAQGMFPVRIVDAVAPGDANANEIQAVLLENWDMEHYQDLRVSLPADKQVIMADWLVCTGSYEMLEEVEYFINVFAGNVPQVQIEAQIVELTETDVLDWGIAKADYNLSDGTFLKSFGFSFPNADTGNEAILSLGAIQNGAVFDAIINAVKTWDNVSVISQPMIAVREGGKAEILNTEELPFFNVKSISNTGTFNATLEFKEVGVRLFIVPRVIGSNTLALHLDLEASQQAGSLTTVVAGTGPSAADLQTPVIAKRSVKTVVYLKKGQALILGGLTTTRQREQERKVPFLGDLPLLGWLFKSRFTQVTKTHVLFFIKPRVLEGQDFQRDF